MKTGKEYLRFSKQAKSEDIAEYMLDLVKESIKEDKNILSIILDNAKTHKNKMRAILSKILAASKLETKVKVDFIYIAKYSPKLNLAEYAIHLIRQKFFHHLPDSMNWKKIIKRIQRYLSNNQLFTKEQVEKTLKHIYSLVL
jgi:transposase